MLEDVATEAPGGDHHPPRVLVEHLPVDPGLVLVALEVGAAGELDGVPVALVGLGQRGEVVVELAALGVAAAVVDPAPAGRALVAALPPMFHPGPEVRLHPLFRALLLKLEVAAQFPWLAVAMGGRTFRSGAASTLPDRRSPAHTRSS